MYVSVLTIRQRTNAAAASRSWFRLENHVERIDYFIYHLFSVMQRVHRHWAALWGNRTAIGSIIHIGTGRQTDSFGDYRLYSFAYHCLPHKASDSVPGVDLSSAHFKFNHSACKLLQSTEVTRKAELYLLGINSQKHHSFPRLPPKKYYITCQPNPCTHMRNQSSRASHLYL